MLGQQRLHSMSSEIFTSVGQIMNLVERMAELSGRLDRVMREQQRPSSLRARAVQSMHAYLQDTGRWVPSQT